MLFRVSLLITVPGLWSSQASDEDLLGKHRADFAVVWKHALDQDFEPGIQTAGGMSDGVAFIALENGRILALDAARGQALWEALPTADHHRHWVACGNSLVITTDDDAIVCRRARDGTAAWVAAVPAPCEGLAADGGGAVYAWAGATLRCIDARDGAIRWGTQAPDSIVAVRDDSRVCVVSARGGRVLALDAATGLIRWQVQAGDEVADRVVLDGASAYIVTKNEAVMALALEDGAVRWRHTFGVDVRLSDPMFVDGAPVFRAGQVLFVTGRGGHNAFRALDCRGGNLIACESIATAPSKDGFGAVGMSAFFSMPYSGPNVVQFDVGRGFITNRFALPGAPELIGSWRNTLLFASDRAVFAVRPRAPAMHSFVPFGSVSLSSVVNAALPAVVVLAMTVVVILVSIRTAGALPATELVRIRFWVAAIALAALAFASLWTAGIFVYLAWTGRGGAGTWLFAAVLAGPPAALAWVVASHVFGGSWPTAAEHRRAARASAHVFLEYRRLRITMGLSRPVALRCEPVGGLGPLAEPRPLQRAGLVVPADLERLALRASEGDESLADSLLRFVLAHELAHVVFRDLWVLPLDRACRVSRRRVGPLVWSTALTTLAYAFIWLASPDHVVSNLGGPIVGTLLVGVGILAVAVPRLRAERERLADATASLEISPKEVQRLTAVPSNAVDELPVLGRFTASLGGSAAHPRSYLGFAAGRSADSSSPMAAIIQRVRDSASKRHLLPLFAEDLGSTVAGALWTGAVASILFTSIASAWTYGFVAALTGTSPPGTDIGAGFLDAMSDFSRWVTWDPQWGQAARSVGLATCGVLLAVSSALPFVPQLRGELLRRRTGALRLVGQVLGGLAAFYLIAALSRAWMRFGGFPLIDAVRTSALPVGAATVVTVCLHLLLTPNAAGIPRHHRSILWRESLGLLAGLAAAMACGFAILQGLAPVERFLWSFNLSSATFWVANLAIGRWLVGFEFLAGERLRAAWFLTFRRVRPALVLPSEQRHSDGVLVDSVIVSVILFILPAIAIAALLQRPLISANIAWYQDGFRTALSTADSVSALATRVYMRPGAGASPAIVSGLLTTAALMLLHAMRAIASTRSYSQEVRRSIRQGAAIARLERLTATSLMPNSTGERLRSTVTRLASRGRLEFRPPYDVLWCRLACDAAACMPSVGVDPRGAAGASLIGFIRSCAVPTGGFGARPGAAANPWHTARAMGIVSETLENLDAHVAYLVRQARSLPGHSATIAPSDWLDMAHLAASALARLGRLNDLAAGDCDRLARATLRVWHRSDQGIGDICNALGLAATLKQGGFTAMDALAGGRVGELDRWLSRANPTNIEQGVDAVAALAVRDPTSFASRPSVQQFVDNVRAAAPKQGRGRRIP